MFENEIRRYVHNGAELLDRCRPWWAEELDELLEGDRCNLDCRKSESCVLGHIYGSYTMGKQTLRLDTQEMISHGFLLSLGIRDQYLYYKTLDEAWFLAMINARLVSG